MSLVPHGYCYLWHSGLVALHLGADALIALAYYSIPLTLFYFVRKRPDLPYGWLFILFGSFILSCGTTHIMAIWTLWHPDYWISGIIKALTAAISIYTAIALIPIIPQILALPTTEELEEEINLRREIETALRTAQVRLSGILTVAKDAIISVDVNQRITLFNQGAEKIFGWTAQEIMGQPLDVLLPSRFVTIHHQHIKEFNKSNDVARTMGKRREILGLRQNGQEFPAEASISQLELAGETIFTVFLRDISEQKQAEQAFKESEQRFRKVFEEGPLGMAIVGLDYHFVNVNNALCQMLGYSASELSELTFPDITHPDDIDKDVTLAQQLYKQEIPDYRLEKRYITKNGQSLWIMLTASLLKDEQGNTRYGFAMIEDISDRKQAEETLKQYKRIVSATNDGIILLDRNYAYKIINQAYLDWHGKTLEDLIGHTVPETMGETVFFTIMKPRLDRCLLGETVHYEDWFFYPVLGRQFISVTYVPYLEKDQTISGVVISLRNVTNLKQIEQSLRENKLKFRQLIDNVKDVLYIHDTQTYELLYLSPAFEEVWGIPSTTVYDNPYAWIDSIHPDDRQNVTTAFEKMIVGTNFNQEYRIIRPNGEIRWIWSRSFPVLDESGKIYRMAGIAEDITERKTIQKTLELQDIIVKNMAEGVCLVNANNGIFVYANPKFEEMFGYELGELKGKHVSIVNYEDESKSAEAVNQEIRGNVLEKGEYSYEVYNVKKDGTPFWCRATATCFDHHDYGNVLVAVQEDINDRKQTQEALKQSEQRLQYLLSSSPAVIFSSKPDGDFGATYISENVVNVLGYNSQDFVKDSNFWIDHIHPDDLEGIITNLPQLLVKELHDHEFRFLMADGTYCWLFEQIRLIRDETGQPKEILGYLVDISDRKQAENKIADSLREKEVLLREIHHRVKNNLQVICSLLNLQLRSLSDPTTRELLRESQNRVRSMALIHEKLYQSKNIASINLAEYINDLGNNLLSSYQIRPVQITLVTEIDSTIYLDVDTAVPCGLILNELISNACKYAFEPETKGEIFIKAIKNENQELVLIVADNGKGLSQDIGLDNIKTLGLQLVKSLTNQLRGKIIIKRNDGTQFYLTLTRI